MKNKLSRRNVELLFSSFDRVDNLEALNNVHIKYNMVGFKEIYNLLTIMSFMENTR